MARKPTARPNKSVADFLRWCSFAADEVSEMLRYAHVAHHADVVLVPSAFIDTHGLYLILTQEQTPEHRRFMELMTRRGYRIASVWGWEHARDETMAYLHGRYAKRIGPVWEWRPDMGEV